jgi:hypothetical protein
MTDSGVLIRQMDPRDARRVFIALSDGAAAQMQMLLGEIKDRMTAMV